MGSAFPPASGTDSALLTTAVFGFLSKNFLPPLLVSAVGSVIP